MIATVPIRMCLVLNVNAMMIETRITIVLMKVTLSKTISMLVVMSTDVHIVMIST